MIRRWSIGWVVLLFGMLLLVVVVGSLLKVADFGDETPTPWQEPAVTTTTPEPEMNTPGWWDDLGTPPVWPTEESPEACGG